MRVQVYLRDDYLLVLYLDCGGKRFCQLPWSITFLTDSQRERELLENVKSMTSLLEICERFGRATGIVGGSWSVSSWYQRSRGPRTVYQTATTGTPHCDL
jgi:hypothetical protein